MRLSDILVVLSADEQAASRYALWLAKTVGAEVTAVAPVLDPNLPYVTAELPSDMLANVHKESERTADLAFSRFFDQAKEHGVAIRQERVQALQGEAGRAIRKFARFYDLTIVDQGNPETGTSFGTVEDILVGSGRPVLVVPYFFKSPAKIRTALVAWDDSAPAARALGDALPLLALADEVQVVTVTDASEDAADRLPREVVRHLARHRIDATPKALISVGDVANTLLSHMADISADLLVMGGYGHSRVRERVLGGATRDILGSMTAPVLMAH